ncbi:hypothetical protein [Kushneria avicenniae]|uniref:hypothetical protein n=1 Tax=Kushneria avicenniae TaxID=402385 RepID=UPI001587DFD7
MLQRAKHGKLLIVDKQYAIVGSFNWLANVRYRDKMTSPKTIRAKWRRLAGVRRQERRI